VSEHTLVWASEILGLLGVFLAAFPTYRAARFAGLLGRMARAARHPGEKDYDAMTAMFWTEIGRRGAIWPWWVKAALIAGYGCIFLSRILSMARL
jgi:hypothetical protein